MKKLSICLDVTVTVFAALFSALALHTFVEPANFAPSGVDGISMMAQKLFGINMGYISLAINIPLLLLAWFSISHKYVLYTTLFTVISSLSMILMETFGMPQYVADGETWIAVFASGILLGMRTALMIRIGASSGGVDIVSSVIQKKKPYLNIESLISAFCYAIIGLSFFVYWNIESILMSVVQMLVFNVAMNHILKSTRKAVEVRIITEHPEEFKNDILNEMKHGATILECRGMYTGSKKTMIITLINIRQMNDLIKLSRRYPDSFMYYGEANGVWGNFRWRRSDEVK